MKDRIKTIQRHIENHELPEHISIQPRQDGGVILYKFRDTNVIIPLSRGEWITDDYDALESVSESLLVRVRVTDDGVITEPKATWFIRSVDTDRHNSADIVYFNEMYTDQSRHNHQNLLIDASPDKRYEFYLFEP